MEEELYGDKLAFEGGSRFSLIQLKNGNEIIFGFSKGKLTLMDGDFGILFERLFGENFTLVVEGFDKIFGRLMMILCDLKTGKFLLGVVRFDGNGPRGLEIVVDEYEHEGRGRFGDGIFDILKNGEDAYCNVEYVSGQRFLLYIGEEREMLEFEILILKENNFEIIVRKNLSHFIEEREDIIKSTITVREDKRFEFVIFGSKMKERKSQNVKILVFSKKSKKLLKSKKLNFPENHIPISSIEYKVSSEGQDTLIVGTEQGECYFIPSILFERNLALVSKKTDSSSIQDILVNPTSDTIYTMSDDYFLPKYFSKISKENFSEQKFLKNITKTNFNGFFRKKNIILEKNGEGNKEAYDSISQADEELDSEDEQACVYEGSDDEFFEKKRLEENKISMEFLGFSKEKQIIFFKSEFFLVRYSLVEDGVISYYPYSLDRFKNDQMEIFLASNFLFLGIKQHGIMVYKLKDKQQLRFLTSYPCEFLRFCDFDLENNLFCLLEKGNKLSFFGFEFLGSNGLLSYCTSYTGKVKSRKDKVEFLLTKSSLVVLIKNQKKSMKVFKGKIKKKSKKKFGRLSLVLVLKNNLCDKNYASLVSKSSSKIFFEIVRKIKYDEMAFVCSHTCSNDAIVQEREVNLGYLDERKNKIFFREKFGKIYIFFSTESYGTELGNSCVDGIKIFDRNLNLEKFVKIQFVELEEVEISNFTIESNFYLFQLKFETTSYFVILDNQNTFFKIMLEGEDMKPDDILHGVLRLHRGRNNLDFGFKKYNFSQYFSQINNLFHS